MKKLIFVILSAICCIFIPTLGASASTNLNNEKLTTQSKSAILIEVNTGTTIYSNNENCRLPIASMTKIMLLNLCFENINEGKLKLDEEITVSKNASGMGGSQVFLEANGKYKVCDLIKSVIIASANDASVALAERLYGSESNCVKEMNNKCIEWGLKNTLFSNCTGLPKPTQYSSAKDVSFMLSKLIRNKDYFKYSNIWMDEIKHEKGNVTGLTNTNKLIKYYDGCDGGKTGFTKESGHCLAATAKRGNMRLISVVICAPDSKTRFADISNMFNFGFDNYACKMVVDNKKPLEIDVKINKSKCDRVEVVAKEPVFIFSEKNVKDNVIIDFLPYKNFAPMKKGDVVGELKIFKDNVEYKKVKVVLCNDVDNKTYFDYIVDIGKNWTI